MPRTLIVLSLGCLLTGVSVPEAYAYIDPGSGSLLLQAFLGAVAAGLVAVKLYWSRLKGFLAGRNTAADKQDRDGGA